MRSMCCRPVYFVVMCVFPSVMPCSDVIYKLCYLLFRNSVLISQNKHCVIMRSVVPRAVLFCFPAINMEQAGNSETLVPVC
jgi:hypothetical protein